MKYRRNYGIDSDREPIFSNRLHGRVVKGVGHLGHDEAMEAGGREFSLHGRVVKGVGHLGHDEATEAGGREFDPRPGHHSRTSF